jgi:Class II flagellar assembly regulator
MPTYLLQALFTIHVDRGGMRIETARPPAVMTAKRADRRGSATAFSGLIEGDDAPMNGAAPAHSLNALTSLIGIQLDEGAQDARRQQEHAVAKAHDALDVLTSMQRALTLGGLTVTHLQQLKSQLTQRKLTNLDQNLVEITAQIDLRLAVEIAKMEYNQAH